MNRTQLVEIIATKSELTKKDADKFLTAYIETITDAMKADDKVTLVGFGTFELRERAAREGRNLQTGEPMHIPATKYPAFKAGKAFKEAVK
ncbi:MAG: HU family DNA-binding protein [Defluviitaleaceae bacterium]|nr:HU family DNA-binding protein [Defluviitaleaceae bacterium]